MHVIARPNHPPVISLPREFQHLLFGLLRGQNAPKMGSKWAYFTCLCTPNGLG